MAIYLQEAIYIAQLPESKLQISSIYSVSICQHFNGSCIKIWRKLIPLCRSINREFHLHNVIFYCYRLLCY